MVAKNGGLKKVLKIPESIDDFFEESKASFHSIKINKDIGLPVVHLGASSKIFNPYTGETIGNEYHAFFLNGKEIWGRTGTTKELVLDLAAFNKSPSSNQIYK